MKRLSRYSRQWLALILLLCGGLLWSDEALGQQALYESAVAETRRILEKKPDDLDALMILGDAYLNLKKGPEAVAVLEKAYRLDPVSLRAAPNLGLAYMMTGDYGKAISTWQVYSRKFPESRMAARLKKQTTVLLHLDAARWAKTSVKQEKILQTTVLDEKVVAVTPFGDRGIAEEARPLRKAIAAMTITDLSKVQSIKVVERVKLQKLMDELQFGASGIVDEKTAPRLGHLLGAGRVVTGSMTSAGKDHIRIVRILRSVTTGEDVGHQDTQGPLNEFFKMQKTVVFGILKNLGITLSKEEEILVGRYDTQSFQAVKFYGEALDAEDRGDWDEASRLYGLCAKADPGSLLSEAATFIPTAVEASAGAGKIKASITAAAAMDNVVLQKMSVIAGPAEGGVLAAGGDIAGHQPMMAPGAPAPPPDSSTVTQNQTQGKVQAPSTQTPSTQTQTRPVTYYGFTVAQIKQEQQAAQTTRYNVYSVDGISNFDPSYNKTTSPTMTIQSFTGSSPSLTQLQVQEGGIRNITTGLPASVTRVELGYNSYTAWGYWTQPSSMNWPDIVGDVVIRSDGPYYFDSRNYYIWGDRTSDADMSYLKTNNISGTYTGNAYGTFTMGGLAAESANMSGTFSSSVNFGSGTISNFNVNVTSGGRSASITAASGTFSGSTSFFNLNTATGTWVIDGAVPTDKSANGSVYGNRGQEIGGQWVMQDSNNLKAVTGIFQGKK